MFLKQMILMDKVIELKNVEKEYDLESCKLQVLKSINLGIKRSEMVSIMGPSGSGKSTMLHMLGCLDRPTRGKVIIDGIDVSKLNDDDLAKIRREKIGFIFQFFYLLPSLTALRNVELPMTFLGYDSKTKEKRAKELLNMVGLEGRINHRPSQLSGGESQRVAIARSLANNPQIILADEPTGNLDSKSGKEVMDILKKLNKENKVTFIIVTHDPLIAKQTDRVIRLKDGKIIDGD
jgi:putative ABC transport system ATP-binding protein